ncbi:MAG: RHS repeat-associated core domain-containing protein [Chloroflexota bacterium]
MGTETILFVGAHFEIKNGNQITKYYMAGSTRIAMRKYTAPQPMTVEYMLSDHLGSTSLTTDANGAKVLEIRYKAWGEIRATWTSSPSTTPAYKMPLYQYTGQASYMDDPLTSGVTEGFGLMFYQSRFYDPALGRMIQADTMLPPSQGVQTWDRYAYVTNSPVRYNDPSGHVRVEDAGTEYGCSDDLYCINGNPKPVESDEQSGSPHDASPAKGDDDSKSACWGIINRNSGYDCNLQVTQSDQMWINSYYAFMSPATAFATQGLGFVLGAAVFGIVGYVIGGGPGGAVLGVTFGGTLGWLLAGAWNQTEQNNMMNVNQHTQAAAASALEGGTVNIRHNPETFGFTVSSNSTLAPTVINSPIAALYTMALIKVETGSWVSPLP